MDMDMGTGLFQATNMALARAYWYAVAGVVALCLAVRLVNTYDARVRLHTRAARARAHPTRPQNAALQAWATLTAVAREAAYPQAASARLLARHPGWAWLTTPLPAGRLLILAAYWIVVVTMMTAGAVVHDASFWERIGFRNAWVAVTQLPLLYLLAGKASVLARLVGSSHERLNWAHRWVARTLFVTASVHGWHFYREYARAGLAAVFWETMPMGRYGVAAWALLGWSCVAGLAPLRRLGYELFVLQHVVTAVVLLWVVYKHVPAYARYNVWFAVAALGLDRVLRLGLLVVQNVRLRRPGRPCCGGCPRCASRQRLGHAAQLRAVGTATTVVTVRDVRFAWRPGQHLYLWVPSLGVLEQHPYTIACAHRLPDTCVCNSIQLVVRRHGGFSKRLHAAAVRLQAEAASSSSTDSSTEPSGCSSSPPLTVFVTGPFGAPPRCDIYETLVLLAASTGASFTLPLLEGVLHAAAHAPNTLCTRRVDVLLCAARGDEIDYYVDRLHALAADAQAVGLELTVVVAVTREQAPVEPATSSSSSSSSSSSASSLSPNDAEKTAPVPQTAEAGPGARLRTPPHTASPNALPPTTIRRIHARPDIEAFIRGPVEASGGETSVVVCGGPSLVARTRNCVARLSDERAVHKGTGAQGIHLHVEEYGF